MVVQTFLLEWDTENLPSLVVAEETLRQKADVLRKMGYSLADKLVDE